MSNPSAVNLPAIPIGDIDMVARSDGDDFPVLTQTVARLYRSLSNKHQVYVEPQENLTVPQSVIGVIDFVGRQMHSYHTDPLNPGPAAASHPWLVHDRATGLLAHPEKHIAFISDVTVCVIAVIPYRDCVAFVLLQHSNISLSVHTYVYRGRLPKDQAARPVCLEDTPLYATYHEYIWKVVQAFSRHAGKKDFRPIKFLVYHVDLAGRLNLRIGA